MYICIDVHIYVYACMCTLPRWILHVNVPQMAGSANKRHVVICFSWNYMSCCRCIHIE